MLPGVGVLYRFEIFTLAIFLVVLWKFRHEKILWLLFLWVLVAPVPAGLTMGVGYAGNRAAGMMPAIQIASAIGFAYLLLFLFSDRHLKVKLFGGVGMVVLLVFSLTTFLRAYFIESPSVAAQGMLYGDLEMGSWLKDNSGYALKILVSRKLSEPHIFIAFTAKWDPANYQGQTKDWNRYKDEDLVFLDQLHRYYLGKYVFQNITTSDLHEDTQTLLVGRPEEFTLDSHVIQKIN
jgi:hypothetical protein